jgi:hypothetical protein
MDKMHVDAPFTPMYPGAVDYAMLQLGYHGGDLIHHLFIAERQNDFYEMLTHHIVAAALLSLMVFANWLSIGCTISFLHDIADIPASFVKALSQTDYTKVTVPFFLGTMIVWGYTRNYLLVKYIIFIVNNLFDCFPEEYKQFNWVTYGATVNLGLMLFLHYYWYFMFIQILLFFKKSGKAEDLQNDVRKTADMKNE